VQVCDGSNVGWVWVERTCGVRWVQVGSLWGRRGQDSQIHAGVGWV